MWGLLLESIAAIGCSRQTKPVPVAVWWQGKVRDTYETGDKLVIVTTDRQSALIAFLPPYLSRCCSTVSSAETCDVNY